MPPPEPETGANAVHVASGTGVSPCRTRNTAPAPGGALAVHDSVPQFTALPASKTRDRNVPLDAYGPMRIQSTVTTPVPAARSLTSGRIDAPIAIGCVATTVPSTEYFTSAGVQSIRKRCGTPSSRAGDRRVRAGAARIRASEQPAARRRAEHGPRRGLERIAEPGVLERRPAERGDELERSAGRIGRERPRPRAIDGERTARHRCGAARGPRGRRPVRRKRGAQELAAGRGAQDDFAVRALCDVCRAIDRARAEVGDRRVGRGEDHRGHREGADRPSSRCCRRRPSR